MNNIDELLERLDVNAANWYLDDGGASEQAAATIRALREAVTTARDIFNHYGELHAAKPDKLKANANYALAAKMHRALTALETSHGRAR